MTIIRHQRSIRRHPMRMMAINHHHRQSHGKPRKVCVDWGLQIDHFLCFSFSRFCIFFFKFLLHQLFTASKFQINRRFIFRLSMDKQTLKSWNFDSLQLVWRKSKNSLKSTLSEKHLLLPLKVTQFHFNIFMSNHSEMESFFFKRKATKNQISCFSLPTSWQYDTCSIILPADVIWPMSKQILVRYFHSHYRNDFSYTKAASVPSFALNHSLPFPLQINALMHFLSSSFFW